MATKLKFSIPLVVVLVALLSSCGTRLKFVAPKIESPVDLIPGYVPRGFKLISGFQLPGELTSLRFSTSDEACFLGDRVRDLPFFEVKSPVGNIIQGVYYQAKDSLILITKSYFPKGDLDQWLDAYQAAQPKPCECDCKILCCLNPSPLLGRLIQLQEMRTIDGTQVAILEGPRGWTTVFVRGDYLLSVESGISLEENLKIVASLLEK
jgi:hypothetical protein